MSIDETSTLSEVLAEYRANLDYDIDGSVTKCKAFIRAARHLIALCLDEATKGDETVRESVGRYQRAHDEAVSWWSSNDSDANTAEGEVRFLDVGGWDR
jgi:hypothetical protein